MQIFWIPWTHTHTGTINYKQMFGIGGFAGVEWGGAGWGRVDARHMPGTCHAWFDAIIVTCQDVGHPMRMLSSRFGGLLELREVECESFLELM